MRSDAIGEEHARVLQIKRGVADGLVDEVALKYKQVTVTAGKVTRRGNRQIGCENVCGWIAAITPGDHRIAEKADRAPGDFHRAGAAESRRDRGARIRRQQ